MCPARLRVGSRNGEHWSPAVSFPTLYPVIEPGLLQGTRCDLMMVTLRQSGGIVFQCIP